MGYISWSPKASASSWTTRPAPCGVVFNLCMTVSPAPLDFQRDSSVESPPCSPFLPAPSLLVSPGIGAPTYRRRPGCPPAPRERRSVMKAASSTP